MQRLQARLLARRHTALLVAIVVAFAVRPLIGDAGAALKQKGAVALDAAQLTKLIVGRTVRVRNAVTGQRFEILYGTGGQRLITAVDGKTPDPTSMVETLHGGQIPYEIHDGHLITQIGGTRFEVTVYRLGDGYVASRDNEYGYANYEVEVAGD